MATMRAATITSLGGPELIHVTSLERPSPGPREVLLKVRAVSVDHVDTFVRSGAYPTPTPFPFVVNRDAVGEIVEAGPDVVLPEGLSRGASAWTNSLGIDGRQGAAAEYAIVPVDRLYPVPPGVDDATLVALVHPAATAYLALHVHGGLPEGPHTEGPRPESPHPEDEPPCSPTVLVVGAAGNVGSAIVALALRAGARVIGSASAAHADLLRARGVEAVVAHDEIDRVADLAPAGVDVAVDTSGRVPISTLLPRVATRGRIVALAGMDLRADFPLGDLYTRDRSIIGFALSQARVTELAAAAETIVAMVREGQLPAPEIDRIGLGELAAAHARLERGSLHGVRIVVDMTR